MTRNEHTEIREMIALGGHLSEAQQSHLEQCADCRNYAESAEKMVRALRSLPVVADSRLVRATQMRVRFHAGRLRETRERLWFVGMACLGVGLSATLTVPLLWRFFAWMAASAGISSPVWEAGFALFWIVPALVVSVLLLVRGSHVVNQRGQSQESR
jgi:hypothetical protein